MIEKYNRIFESYLRLCKSKYDIENPYSNLEECCTTCNRCLWELSGMLTLLEYTGEITFEQREKEFKRVLDNFSTHKLYNAFMENGEIMVYSN
jgi:hypothetical protein